jgi:hypothetical protein
MVFALRENFVFPISLLAKWSQGKICLEQILAALAARRVQYMEVLHPKDMLNVFFFFLLAYSRVTETSAYCSGGYTPVNNIKD